MDEKTDKPVKKVVAVETISPRKLRVRSKNQVESMYESPAVIKRAKTQKKNSQTKNEKPTTSQGKTLTTKATVLEKIELTKSEEEKPSTNQVISRKRNSPKIVKPETSESEATSPKTSKSSSRRSIKEVDSKAEEPEIEEMGLKVSKKAASGASTKKVEVNKSSNDFTTIDYNCAKLNPEGRQSNHNIACWNVRDLRAWLGKELGIDEGGQVHYQLPTGRPGRPSFMRRSMSVGHLDNLNLSEPSNEDVDEINTSLSETHLSNETMTLRTNNQQNGSAQDLTQFNKRQMNAPINNRFQKKRTIPKTPQLLSRNRIRPTNLLTYEEREFKEFQEKQKSKFRLELNKKVLKSIQPPNIVPKKPNTIIKPFKITQTKPPSTATKENHIVQFKAQKLNESILHHVVGVKPKMTLPVTVPDTPLVLKRPKQSKIRLNEHNDDTSENSSTNSNSTTNKSKSINPPNKLLERCEQMLERKKQFVAQQLAKEIEQPIFHARSPKVLHQEPFKPKHKPAPPIEVQEFALSYATRAKEREEYEKQKKEREMAKEELRKQYELEMERQEKDKLMKLRQQTIHKPVPIPSMPKSEIIHKTSFTIPDTPLVLKRSNKKCLQ